MKKITLIMFAIALTSTLLTACGTTGKFVYPANMSQVIQLSSEPVNDFKCVVLPFDDFRGDVNNVSTLIYYYIPLIPYGWVEYERPDAANMFLTIDKFDCTPSEDLAKATAISLRHSNLFKDAYFSFGKEIGESDLIWSARLKRMSYHGTMYSYCVSIFAPYVWTLGAPIGKSKNSISVEFVVKNKAGKEIWSYSKDVEDSQLQWFYHGMGNDCKPFSSMYQNIMNEAITSLSSTLSKNPNLIKK